MTQRASMSRRPLASAPRTGSITTCLGWWNEVRSGSPTRARASKSLRSCSQPKRRYSEHWVRCCKNWGRLRPPKPIWREQPNSKLSNNLFDRTVAVFYQLEVSPKCPELHLLVIEAHQLQNRRMQITI